MVYIFIPLNSILIVVIKVILGLVAPATAPATIAKEEAINL